MADFAAALHRLLSAAVEAAMAAMGASSGDDDEEGGGVIGGCAMCGRQMPLTFHHLIPRWVRSARLRGAHIRYLEYSTMKRVREAVGPSARCVAVRSYVCPLADCAVQSVHDIRRQLHAVLVRSYVAEAVWAELKAFLCCPSLWLRRDVHSKYKKKGMALEDLNRGIDICRWVKGKRVCRSL